MSVWENVDEVFDELREIRGALEQRDERIADLERALDTRADQVTRLRAEQSALERENQRLRERLEACSESLAAVQQRRETEVSD